MVHPALFRLAGEVFAVGIKMLELFLGRALLPPFPASLGPLGERDWRFLRPFRLLRNNRIFRAVSTEDILQKRQRLRTAHLKARITVPAKNVHHLFGHIFKVIIRNAHLLHQIADRLQPQFFGTFQAKPLVDRLVPVQTGHEHHGKSFFASCTHHIHVSITSFLNNPWQI